MTPNARWKARQRETRRQRGCWRLLGLGYITSTHQATDRCRRCGFRLKAEAREAK